MASHTCWQCLSRLRISSPSPFHISFHDVQKFSTTSLKAANPPKAKKSAQLRVPKSATTKGFGKKGKGNAGSSKRAPGPGERRAFQKRIILSNVNAAEVGGVPELDVAFASSDANVGSMVSLPGAMLDSLRALEAFKVTQGWGYFRRPTTLIRNETLQLARHISQGGQQPMQRMIIGDKGCGKSVLLLQAQAMAFSNNWIVIHIPEGQDLTNAHTGYAPIPNNSGPIKYAQKTYMSSLLERIVKANEPVLSNFKLSQDHEISAPIQPDMKLSRFAEIGVRDADQAWPIFTALWKELTSTTRSAKSDKRPPILLTLDGLAHVSRLSEYIAPSMHHIHAHDLAIVHHFISCLSGATELPNGGMVLAADSGSNRPASPALDLAISQSESMLKDGITDLPLYDPKQPFVPVDARILASMRNVEVMRLPGFSRDEARAVLEYYAKSGLLRQTITDHFVTEKWLMAGGGIVGELERGTIRAGL